jgi:ankyrin repeat protein
MEFTFLMDSINREEEWGVSYYLTQISINVNRIDDESCLTPMSLACIKGNVHIARLLSLYGASSTLIDGAGVPPLFGKIQFDHFDNVVCLIDELDADVGFINGNGEDIFFTAVKYNRLSLARYLFYKIKPDVNRFTNDNTNPKICTSIIRGTESMSLFLINECKANLGVDIGLGITPLIMASTHNPKKVCKKILQKKCVDINHSSNCGVTALIAAASHGHLKIIQVLLHKGADPRMTTIEGFNAKSTARKRGHKLVFEYLKKHNKRMVCHGCGVFSENGKIKKCGKCLKLSILKVEFIELSLLCLDTHFTI